jgi:hypothetical protein
VVPFTYHFVQLCRDDCRLSNFRDEISDRSFRVKLQSLIDSCLIRKVTVLWREVSVTTGEGAIIAMHWMDNSVYYNWS